MTAALSRHRGAALGLPEPGAFTSDAWLQPKDDAKRGKDTLLPTMPMTKAGQGSGQ